MPKVQRATPLAVEGAKQTVLLAADLMSEAAANLLDAVLILDQPNTVTLAGRARWQARNLRHQADILRKRVGKKQTPA